MPEPRLGLLRDEEGWLLTKNNSQLRLGEIIVTLHRNPLFLTITNSNAQLRLGDSCRTLFTVILDSSFRIQRQWSLAADSAFNVDKGKLGRIFQTTTKSSKSRKRMENEQRENAAYMPLSGGQSLHSDSNKLPWFLLPILEARDA